MTHRIIKSLVLLALFLSTIFFIYEINFISRDSNILGGNLFLTQLQFLTSAKIVLSLLILFTAIRFLLRKYKSRIDDFGNLKVFIFLVSLSFLIKLLLFEFNNDSVSISNDLYRIFERGEFNQYKSYMYLALVINSLSENAGTVLMFINSILSSLTVGVFYLILRQMRLSMPVIIFSLFLILAYIPFHANDMLLRVDVLFTFLFVVFIFLLYKFKDEFKVSNFLVINIFAIMLCMTRESVVYLLPIFIIILATSSEKRVFSIITLSFTILISSSLISHNNQSNYGISSIVRDHHLILKMQYYGYLNQGIIDSYQSKLSNEGKLLLNDIKKAYDLNILPHKREPFDLSKFGTLNNFAPDTPTRYAAYGGFILLEKMGLGGDIRPDVQNVLNKNAITQYKGDRKKVQQYMIEAVRKDPVELSYNNLESRLLDVQNEFTNKDDKNLAIYLSGLLFSIYLNEEEHLKDYSFGSCKSTKISDNDLNLLNKSCVIEKIKQMSHNFLLARSDNWSYKRASIPFVWKFDEKEKYITHPNLEKTVEIILAKPSLYISQSLITLFSMSGYVPIPSMIAKQGQAYSRGIFPDFFLYKFQSIFQVLMNFWYVICFLLLVKFSLGASYRKNINNEFIILFIPLYYGLFIVFASPFEFNRLLIPITPYIFVSFSILIYMISDIFDELIKWFRDKSQN